MAKSIKLTQEQYDKLIKLIEPTEEPVVEEVELKLEEPEEEIKLDIPSPSTDNDGVIESLKEKISSLEHDLQNEKEQNAKWRELFNEKNKQIESPKPLTQRKGW